MENWFLLYLLTRLDFVLGLAIFTMIVGGIAAVISAILAALMYAEREKSREMFGTEHKYFKNEDRWFGTWRKLSRAALLIAIPGTVAAAIVPSKNDVFFIVGGSAIIEAVHTDTAKRIGSKSLEAVESWLDENMPKKAEPAK